MEKVMANILKIPKNWNI